jgi:cyclophilin family peptidyl-prolyl cis-trans isomerase
MEVNQSYLNPLLLLLIRFLYVEPFENEVHSRLKFNRRGLVAFANNGDKRSNQSQWFITLGQ